MKRILIVGVPGAGKTVFSRKLAEKTGLPLVHLDFYYHQTKFNYYNDKPAWKKKVEELVARDKWIIEGNYHSTYNIRFARADCILLLDIPKTKAIYRVLKRHVTSRNKRRPEMPTEWREKIGRDFIKHIWNFDKKEVPKVYRELSNHESKELIVIKNTKQANEFLEML